MKRTTQQTDETRLMGLNEAAAYLGVTLRSLYRLIARGNLTPVRLPGLRRSLIDRRDLDGFVETVKHMGDR